MTPGEKTVLLQRLFEQVSNLGVLSWGPTEKGYRWSCEDYATAVRLAGILLSNAEELNLDRETFPHRYEPENGPTLIIEPIADPVTNGGDKSASRVRS